MKFLHYLKWDIPGLFFVYFRSLSNKQQYNLYKKIYVKNVHQVYGAGIRTNNLKIASHKQ